MRRYGGMCSLCNEKPSVQRKSSPFRNGWIWVTDSLFKYDGLLRTDYWLQLSILGCNAFIILSIVFHVVIDRNFMIAFFIPFFFFSCDTKMILYWTRKTCWLMSSNAAPNLFARTHMHLHSNSHHALFYSCVWSDYPPTLYMGPLRLTTL